MRNRYVHALTQKLDATFDRAGLLGYDSELQADFAKYLCILVSGFLERCVESIVVDYARENANPSFARYVEVTIRRRLRSRSANAHLLAVLVADFGAEIILDEESKEVIASVYGSRNQLAHGTDVGITLTQVREYYDVVKDTVWKLDRVLT